MGNLVHSLELDRGELAEGSLTTPAVIRPLDPSDDGQAELLSGAPALPVQNVSLEQGEEGLHGGVVGAGPGATHRADEPTTPERPDELLRPELAASVGVDHGATGTPELDRVAKRRDGERGLHPGVHRVAHDAAGERVLHRAQVELASVALMLGDLGEPKLAAALCTEDPPEQAILDRIPRPRPRA